MGHETQQVVAVLLSAAVFTAAAVVIEHRHVLLQRRENTFRSMLPAEDQERLAQQDADDVWERQY
jgi:hypothetical protein